MKYTYVLFFIQIEQSYSHTVHRERRDLIGFNRLGNNIATWYVGRIRQTHLSKPLITNIFQQMLASSNVSLEIKLELKSFLHHEPNTLLDQLTLLLGTVQVTAT